MTSATRTRSRSRTSARTSAHRASGGLSPRVVALGVTAAIALVIGVVAGFLFLKPASPSAPTATAIEQGTPAAEVAVPTAEAPGPVRVTNGIPSGFLRGPEGAVAAANAFTQSAVRFSTQPPATTQAAARQIIIPGVDPEAAFVTPTAFLREKIGSRPDTAVRTVPIGSKTTALTSDRATVNVWVAVLSANAAGIETAGGVVPSLGEASFFTTTVSLVYRNGDWRLAGLAAAEGPGVALGAENTLDAAALGDQLRGYTPFQYFPPTGASR
jgi:hypothetical protein